jgi:O-6-methylguanine DNA methyltransferase
MMRAGMDSPLGPIAIEEKDGLITALHWTAAPAPTTPLLAEVVAQLQAYFDRRLTRFDLPLDMGAGFQGMVNRAMFEISYGDTKTYGDLAKALGRPAQAIGQGCGANAIPILIPCHRVLGAKTLGGFSAKGGVESKVFLLRLEGAAGLLI